MKEVAEGIFKQMKNEADAQKEYAEFLVDFEEELDKEDVDTIHELMADEANHSIKLMAMARKYSGVKPADDDLKEAVDQFVKSHQLLKE